MSLKDRLASAWNAFQTEPKRREEAIEETSQVVFTSTGSPSYFRNDRHRMRFSSEYSILNSIYNRIANDIASVQIQHIRADDEGRYKETIKSGLNECMTLSANLDQTSRDFWLDLIISMLDEGVVAAVPVDTNVNADRNRSFDVLSLRTGKIIEWMPSYVKMEVYNERNGNQEQITLPKEKVAILENPFYSVMNEPNSTLKRLVYKMNLLDQIDGRKASTKLNMLVQLPYSLKSPTRVAQAEERRKILEDQLENSKYGVAYIDSTEHITQINRAIENDLPAQIQTLTDQLYNQIGISADIFKGTANQEQTLVYNKKVLKPILDLIELEFTRKFLTPTARSQGQKVAYFIDAFDMVTPGEVGEMANSLSRNEILSANEFRAVLGFKPNDSERSDQLINKNIPIAQIDPNANDSNTSSNDLHLNVQGMNSPEEVEEYLAQLDDLEKQAITHSDYDPVARHERYLREREKLGIGMGSNKGSLSDKIKSAYDTSSLATDAFREASRRKQKTLSNNLIKEQRKFYSRKQDPDEGVNYATIRGNVQSLSDQIRQSGGDLQDWIKEERTALESRLRELYSKAGIKYNPESNDKKLEKERKDRQNKVNKLADKIYK